MTDTATEQQAIPAGEGITSFEVSATYGDKVNGILVSQTTRLGYEFGRPVQSVDLVEPHAEASGLAYDLAQRDVEQRVAEIKANQPAPTIPAAPQPQTQAAGAGAPPPQVPQAPAAAPAPSGDGWAVGQKPNGKGQIRYVTTNAMSTDAFRDAIAQAIAAAGYDPSSYLIYDNRVGDRGLEAGETNWSVANVKPAEGNPMADDPDFKTDRGGTKSAFFVDFNADGSVKVKETSVMEDFVKAFRKAQAMSGTAAPAAPPPPPPADDDVPF